MNRRTSPQYTKILLQSLILTIFVVSFLYIITSSYYVQHVLAQVENNNNTLTLSGLYSRVEKSIVEVTYSNVSTSNLMAPNSTIWPGFVYDKDGHIITLSYGRFQNIYVTFPDHTTYPASLIGSDPATNTTVLQVESIPKTMFFPLSLGNSTELSIGEQVATIGNPYGLSGSLNTGVVSQIGRSVSNPYTGFAAPNAIQTNIPLDPGAIGGPLLNMKGQVVGITIPSFYTYHGTSYGYLHAGFALPSNSLNVIIPSIIKNGTFERPWLGIFTGPISPDLAKSTGLPTNYTGLVVWRVQPNSPAEMAGLQGVTQDPFSGTLHLGDIILAADGQPVRAPDDLGNYIAAHKSVGDRILLTVYRHGLKMNMNAVLQRQTSPQSQTIKRPNMTNTLSFTAILVPYNNTFLSKMGYYQVKTFNFSTGLHSELCPFGNCQYGIEKEEFFPAPIENGYAFKGDLKVSATQGNTVYSKFYPMTADLIKVGSVQSPGKVTEQLTGTAKIESKVTNATLEYSVTNATLEMNPTNPVLSLQAIRQR